MNSKKIIGYVSIFLITIALIYAFFTFRKAFSENTNFDQKSVYVYIPTNASPQQAMDSIKKVVKNWDQFHSVFTQFEMDRNWKPGRFLIERGMTNFEIANALKTNVPVKLTFNNQERIEDLAARIDKALEPTEEEVLTTFTDAKFLAENNATYQEAIALFMPNTYEFYWNTNPLKIRNVIHKEYIKFWNNDRLNKAKTLGLTPLQVVTLASIVQKETAKVDERPRVAGAYLNRLKKGMMLQADPTVIYAKKLVNNQFDSIIKRVYLKDLTINNPYNTYRNNGLPPGPIAMPDTNVIDAVLNHEKHNYIYFCASVTRLGYHEFAETLDQHAINRNKYTKWLNEKNIK